MRVSVQYLSGKVTEFNLETFCDPNPFDDRGYAGKNIMTELDLRLDLLEAEGLRLDVYWYNSVVDEQTVKTIDADVHASREIPLAGREAGRFIRLIALKELDDIAKIAVDGEVVVWRQDDCLINAIKFTTQEMICCSGENTSINARVLEIYHYLRNIYPERTDEEICQMFGYPSVAFQKILLAEQAQMQSDEDESSQNDTEMACELDDIEDLDGMDALAAYLRS